ncbi:hypothetical protein M427DRAFT_94336 [Gonapodya prolifera JEL478]|uniref:Phytanoyl-CoA dioxygenase n=1 Tax=Gonapodya prolifera (strain JEL478) TaxID=1344416 RepID=A0A139AUN2_GONPJ|nr:hypothetical protein M427DRAFT_94336 [Gonapodya prolifera JEL478]|eukprot:KXS20441.1 hypothetical protein M427DRAFT_94336 [Gonapodya prolifera JEL478]
MHPTVRTLAELDLVREDLARDGYAAVQAVPDSDRLQHLRDGFWDWLEHFDPAIKRNDPRTWDSPNGPTSFYGILHGYGISHAQFLWDLRTDEKVGKVFAELWGTDKLLVSFDGACFMQPPEYFRNKWKRFSSWAHIDQPRDKSGLHCYQGLVTLYDANEQDGGLVVWRGSHTKVTEALGTATVFDEDYEGLERVCKMKGCERVKLCGPAGTLFLWDSRTVHCNAAPDPKRHLEEPIPRMVGYVCMLPRAVATEENLHRKAVAFENMWGHGHDPCASAG